MEPRHTFIRSAYSVGAHFAFVVVAPDDSAGQRALRAGFVADIIGFNSGFAP